MRKTQYQSLTLLHFIRSNSIHVHADIFCKVWFVPLPNDCILVVFCQFWFHGFTRVVPEKNLDNYINSLCWMNSPNNDSQSSLR